MSENAKKSKKVGFIGFYNYTVWLTYLSLLSGVVGIIAALSDWGRPYLGMFFLMFSGLCDTFDGKVARTKKNRSEMEKGFGVQIDSLADMVAFGVLPACIGDALVRVSPTFSYLHKFKELAFGDACLYILFFLTILFYVLAALIRLAYFNVTEEERQRTEGGKRLFYEGLPVTSSALIFPLVLVIQYFTPVDLTWLYFVVLFITAVCFIFRFKVIKPGNKGISGLLTIGAVIFFLLILKTLILHH